MTTSQAYIQQLIDLRRYQQAEELLRKALAADPNDSELHARLAFVLYRQDHDAEALQEIQIAISLAPSDPQNHYLLAHIQLSLEHEEAALTAIRDALRLDPTEARFHATLGRIYARRKEWYRALEAAEKGLTLDPTHVDCLNLRATAQARIGRRTEARQTRQEALRQAPDDASTHAQQGWALLEEGQAQEAFAHFREALRLDPLSLWAREGIVEALRARNPLYRLLLRYFLWVGGLTWGERWAVWTSISIGMQSLRALARSFFPLWLLVLPLEFAHDLFLGLTWTARPLFALLVRLDKLGRHALPHEEIVASNWVLVCLLGGLAGLVAAPLTSNLGFLLLPLAALGLLIPISGVFIAPRGWVRWILTGYTILLALAALGMTIAAVTQTAVGAGIAIALGIAFVVGTPAYPTTAVLLMLVGGFAKQLKQAMTAQP